MVSCPNPKRRGRETRFARAQVRTAGFSRPRLPAHRPPLGFRVPTAVQWRDRFLHRARSRRKPASPILRHPADPFGRRSRHVFDSCRRLPHELDAVVTARQLRDRAMVAMLIGCGLRRAELLGLHLESVQQREERWVIADLVGKAGHVRTVAIPNVGEDCRRRLDRQPGSRTVRCSARSTRLGASGETACHPRCCGMSSAPLRLARASTSWPHTTCGARAPVCAIWPVANWTKSSSCLRHVSIQTTERYLGCKQKLRVAVNDRLGIEPDAA